MALNCDFRVSKNSQQPKILLFLLSNIFLNLEHASMIAWVNTKARRGLIRMRLIEEEGDLCCDILPSGMIFQSWAINDKKDAEE
jgi:hypothetical protein